MTDENLMLIAGTGGGKSTFIGGLRHTARESDDYDVRAVPRVGDETEIDDNIFGRMSGEHLYPDTSDEVAIVETKIDGSASLAGGVTVEFVEMPGQQQEKVIDDLMNEIETGELDPDSVEEEYKSDLSDKMSGSDTDLDPGNNEYKKMYRHSYVKSDCVIFLFNLFKILHNDQRSLAYDAGDIGRVARNRRTALVISALDALPRGDPLEDSSDGSDSDDGGSLIKFFEDTLKTAWQGDAVDDDVMDALDTQLRAHPRADDIAREAKRNPNIDVLAVSVPAEDPMTEVGHLKRDGLGFETRGFEIVIDWISGSGV